MDHSWIKGWKEHKVRRCMIDVCSVCGALKVMGIATRYIQPCDASQFLTTPKEVKEYPYFECTR